MHGNKLWRDLCVTNKFQDTQKSIKLKINTFLYQPLRLSQTFYTWHVAEVTPNN